MATGPLSTALHGITVTGLGDSRITSVRMKASFALKRKKHGLVHLVAGVFVTSEK